MASRRAGFTTRASCLLAAGGTALLCGLLLGIVDLARAGVLALAVPLLSSLVVLRSRVQIANRRSVDPARANSGDTVVMHLTISNRSLLPTGPLMLEDQLPSQLHGNARFAIDGLLSRESRTVSYRMPRLPRGRYRAGPLHIRLTDPFHLVDVRRSFTATNEIIVAPIIDTLRNVEAPRSLDVGDDAGSHSIGARGADDASTREYRTGDDLRKIHWRSTARTGALMVRQEERPWQGHLTVLLDLRRCAHTEMPSGSSSVEDERVTNSLEWAISAAATMASYAIVNNREISMISDPGAPTRLPMVETSTVAEHLATIRPSAALNFDALDGLLGSIARESTLIAILGELDPRSLHQLAGVHPRGASTPALAMLLDTGTWALGPGSDESLSSAQVRNAARVLRSAGWQTLIVRCGDGVAPSLQRLLTKRGMNTTRSSDGGAAMTATETAPVKVSRPTERRSDVRRTLLALLATALGVFPLNELFVDRGWMIDVWLAMLVVVGPAALLRRTRPASAGQIWIGVALLIPWLTLNFVRAHAVLGFVPLAGTWHDVGHLMTNLHKTTAHGVAPVHTTVAIRLALCALLGLIAALVDLVAVVGRRGALAGVPLLVSFTIAGAVPRHPVSWLWFVVAAAAFLILLALDSGDDLQRWGHYIPRSSRSRRQAAGAVSAQRIAVIAIAAAVVLPMFIPSNSRNFVANLFHHGAGGSGNGFGENDIHSGSGTSGIDPFAALFGELNRNTTVNLLTVRVSSHDSRFGTKGHQPFYLRTNVLPVFTGDGWRPGPDGTDTPVDSTQFDSSPGTPFAPSVLTFNAQITVRSLHSNPPVFASPSAMSGLSSSTKWSKQNQLLVGSTVGTGQVVQETVSQPAPTQAQLAAATTSDQALDPWLKLPAVSSYVRSLTASLVHNANTPYERARAISDFFAARRSGFSYSLDAPKGDSGDALTNFLKNRTGYCQQYAASMAVMLRLAHVPSRVVLGYAHDVPNASGTFTVTNLDAHAWVEAYFAGVGWVPFDPTPLAGISGQGANDLLWAPHKGGTGGAGQTGPQEPSFSRSSIPRAVQPHPNPVAGAPRATDQGLPVFWLVVLIVVAVIVVVLLVPALVRWRRRRHRLHLARHGDTDALWTELSDTATDLGYVWSPARTPRQVANWLGGTSRQADSSLVTLTRAVEVARYAPDSARPGPELVHELATIESGLRSRRTTAERLRATFWPASLDWSRVPVVGGWLPGSGSRRRH